MYVATWRAGKVSIRASVTVAQPLTGAKLRAAYVESVPAMTFGLATFRDGAVVLGPFTLLRFGAPVVTRTSVEWPIEGGLLAGAPGGTWRIHAAGRHVDATVTAFRPRLPRAVYTLTHLQVHELFTRLYLLRLHGRDEAVASVPRDRRLRAASIDLALCLALARLTGSRRAGRRARRALAIAAIYHVACWSVWGRTLGGLGLRQRVVAVDGSRPTAQQGLLRLAFLPMSWLARRPLHDDVAQTEVVDG